MDFPTVGVRLTVALRLILTTEKAGAIRLFFAAKELLSLAGKC